MMLKVNLIILPILLFSCSHLKENPTFQVHSKAQQYSECFHDFARLNNHSRALECALNASRFYRYFVDLNSATSIIIDVKKLPLTAEEKFEVLFEELLITFEKYGGTSAEEQWQSLMAFVNKSIKKNDSFASRMQLVRVYFNPYKPNIDDEKSVLEILKKYSAAYKHSQPSNLFWPHLTLAKVYRRKKNYSKAQNHLTNAYRYYQLYSPDLGLELNKYYFEVFIQSLAQKNLHSAKFAIDNYREVTMQHLPIKPFQKLIPVLSKMLSEEPVTSKVQLNDIEDQFGPGHYTREGLSFLKMVRPDIFCVE